MIDFAPLVYDKLLQKHGAAFQIDMAAEKMAELMLVIRQFRRGATDRAGVAAAVAEVQIHLEQVRLVVGADLVDGARAAKIELLDRSLQKGNS